MTSMVEGSTEIRPFRVDMPDETIADLRRRLAATRWPSQELVDDRSQGVQLMAIRELARYWTTEYDWRKCEARLNALPMFKTEIDGLDIHFIHVKSRHENALPLIITHGWPGSVIELLGAVGPLTDPTGHGGSAEDAFDLVLPSVPGYGFSGEPTEIGWNPGRVAPAWAELMRRLGYTRYVAQGGDVGAAITDTMGRQAPEGLAGIHLNLLVTALGGPPSTESEAERAAASQLATFRTSGIGYLIEQNTRPQTIGYALLDSPVALAAWMLDHDTDAYYKISRAFTGGQPSGGLTRDHILDNITTYWLTGTGASAARSYWEGTRATALAAGQPRPEVKLPVGFTVFPGEIFRAPRSWAEKAYPTLTYFHEADRGGHFAAWEEPELFATEIRAAFKSLR
jgi:pimeloyl-ACP methyl ester carboxylesterase